MEINRKHIQIILVVGFIAATARTAYIFYERRQAEKAPAKAAPSRELKSDDYVFLRSLHAYDFSSVKQKLEGMTVWVRSGNAVTYYQPGTKKEVGLLPPTARLKVDRVVMQGDQIMADFRLEDPSESGHFYAPIGAVKGSDSRLIVDELFYFDDPHALYKHWPQATWDAVARHEITPGMNERQATMAMGIGRSPNMNGDYGNRTLQYQHAGKTVEVTFRGDSAIKVEEKKE